MTHQPKSLIQTYTGDLSSIQSQINIAISNMSDDWKLKEISFTYAPGAIPGTGLACMCLWERWNSS